MLYVTGCFTSYRYQVKVHPAAQQKILGNIRENPAIRIKGLSQVHTKFMCITFQAKYVDTFSATVSFQCIFTLSTVTITHAQRNNSHAVT